jgi:copper homeostasis protein
MLLNHPDNILLEACVETLEEAIAAERLGAHRLELCARLDLDGITPPVDLIRHVREAVQIPVKVMIRPRAGNFIYTSGELELMKRDIMICKSLGIHGVVIGLLDENNQLDLESIYLLADLAAPMNVTLHKAIDLCNDPVREIRSLKKMRKVHAVLTSGKMPTAQEGQGLIRSLIHEAGKDLTIIAAGKVTSKNLGELHTLIEAKEYHGRHIVG